MQLGPVRPHALEVGTELAHDLADHIALTESPGGVYDRVQSSAPRRRAGVKRLRSEHHDFGDAINGYLAVLEHGGTLADLPVFREELTRLMGRLRRHRQAGSDLIYEAYDDASTLLGLQRNPQQ